MCPAYLTHNVNLDAKLANGTSIREHSLAFDSKEDKILLDRLVRTTPVGGTIDLPSPPTAINVEIYPDFHGDTKEMLSKKAAKRIDWTQGSIVNDGRIIIPIDKRTSTYQTESIRACGRSFHFRASTVPMADSFPIELGFCITVPKAQGRTIHKLIASISEHPCKFLQIQWESLYVLLSCIQERSDLSLLLQLGNRNTLQYISKLKKDPYTASYFAGFPKESSDEIVYWDETLAAKEASFLGR